MLWFFLSTPLKTTKTLCSKKNVVYLNLQTELCTILINQKFDKFMKALKVVVIHIIICLVSFNAVGSQEINDSLNQLIRTSNNEITRQHAMIQLADKIMPTHMDSASSLIQASANLRKLPDGVEKADYYNTLAVYQWFRGEFDSAIHYLYPVIAMPETPEMLPKLARAYNNIGALYSRIIEHDSASKYLHESLRIDELRDNCYGLAKTYYDLSVLFQRQGYYEQALRYQLESIAINEDAQDTMRLIHGLNVLGNIYSKLNETGKATDAFLRAIELNDHYEKMNNLPVLYNNLSAMLCNDPSHFEEAISYAQQGIQVAQKNNDKEALMLLHANIGGAYLANNEPSEALQQLYISLNFLKQLKPRKHREGIFTNLASAHFALNNYDSASHYAQKALLIAREHNLRHWENQALFLLSRADSATGNYRSALDHFQQAVAARDSIWNLENRNRIAELQVIYETEKKESENKMLAEQNYLSQKIIKSQRLLIFLGVSILVLLIIVLAREHLLKKKILKINADILKQQNLINQKNLELNELNTTKDKFFSIISHDLRGPFSSLNSLLNLLAEEFDSMNDADKHKIIHALRQTSVNTLNLLENLLNWARSQTGSIENNPEKIDIHKITGQVIEILDVRAKQKKQKLLNEIPDFTYVYADEQLTKSILINLTNNAIKFSNEGAIIRLTTKPLNDFIEISVVDNGIGIPKDKLENLFRPDSNFKRPGTANEPGTGLGLVMAGEFVRIIGGDISIESEVDKGSTFSFTLPLHKTQGQPG